MDTNNNPETDQSLSVKAWPNYKDLAKEIGVNTETVRLAIHSGEIPGTKIPGRGLCVDRIRYLRILSDRASHAENVKPLTF